MFKLLNTYTITVPKDYNHETCIEDFRKKKEFYHFNENITDKNFSKVSHKLKGKYIVKAFSMPNGTTSKECLAKIKKEKGYLVGVQGLALFYEQTKDLRKNKWYVSFDKEENLWEDADGGPRVPNMGVYCGGVFDFNLGCFEYDWGDGNVLLCFSDFDNTLEPKTLEKPLDIKILEIEINGQRYKLVN